MAAEYLELSPNNYIQFPEGLDTKGKQEFANKAFQSFKQAGTEQYVQQGNDFVKQQQAQQNYMLQNTQASRTQAQQAIGQQTAPGLGRVNFENISPQDRAVIERSLGVQTQTQQPAAPGQESLPQRLLRYAKTGGQMALESALPTAGGVLGGLGGLATPIPGGALIGEMAGSAGGEYLNQKLGITEPSAAGVGLAAAAPLGGRVIGAGLKALPISKAGAIKQISKLLPAEASEALFAKAGTQGLSAAETLPIAKDLLNRTAALGVNNKPAGEIFDKLTTGAGLSLKEAEAIKGQLQGLSLHHSRLGTEAYNPTLASEYAAIKQGLIDQIDQVNPSYGAALKAYGREQNIKRLTSLIETPGAQTPAERLGQLINKPISDLKGTNKMLVQGFDPAELAEIHGILKKIPAGVGIKSLIEARIAGGALGGAAGGLIGYHQGGTTGATAGILAGMLAVPVGRRMLGELIKSGNIKNPAAVQGTMQLFKAMSSRIPQMKSKEYGEEPYPLPE
jgi:hypothetical protein